MIIDITKITKTIEGHKAVYVNTRVVAGQDECITIHEFAVIDPGLSASSHIFYYNENGIRIGYKGTPAKWTLMLDARYHLVEIHLVEFEKEYKHLSEGI